MAFLGFVCWRLCGDVLNVFPLDFSTRCSLVFSGVCVRVFFFFVFSLEFLPNFPSLRRGFQNFFRGFSRRSSFDFLCLCRDFLASPRLPWVLFTIFLFFLVFV